jgi:lipopolysaccharide export LptBFGC system permease protein LptF
MNNYWYIIRIIYPAAFMLSGMTILVCYYLWRLPDSNKEELKYWLLSKADVKRLEKLQKELRDIDRKSFSARNAPSVGNNEKIISRLRANKKVLEKLKFYTQKRLERMKRMSKNAEEFAASLQNSIDVMDEEMKKRNEDIEKALAALETEAQKRNKKMKPKQPMERRFSPMDLDRLRHIARPRPEKEEE